MMDALTTSTSLDAFMKELFHDAMGFAACEMIRRIVGVAHVEDMESIKDIPTRAYREFAAGKQG